MLKKIHQNGHAKVMTCPHNSILEFVCSSFNFRLNHIEGGVDLTSRFRPWNSLVIIKILKWWSQANVRLKRET